MSADDLATALTNGASGWMVLSVAAVLPILWAFTLSLHFCRPYILRFLQKLTLRFGGDVWWLSYALTRDALLVITLCLSVVFVFPNLYLKIGLPITAPIATLVLFWATLVKLFRDPDDNADDFRLFSLLLVVASILYIVPQVYGMEAADQALFGSQIGHSPMISIDNLALAKPILWATLALFSATGAVVFGKFMIALGKPVDGEASPAEG